MTAADIEDITRQIEETVAGRFGVRLDDLQRREAAVWAAYRLLRAMLLDSNHGATAALLEEQWRGFAIEAKVKW